MTTPRDLMTAALQNGGVLAADETIDGDQVTGLLARFNRMLSMWSTQGALIYADTLVSKVLTAGDGDYTIGSGGNINTSKPIKIKDAYVRSGTTDHPIEIIDEYKYNAIPVKTSQGTPLELYYRTGHPTGTIYLYPVPSTADTLYLEVLAPLTSVTIDQVLSLPEGYEEALEYNFLKRVAPMYGKVLTPEQNEIADTGLENIKRANRLNDRLEATIDAPGQCGGGFDIYSRRNV